MNTIFDLDKDVNNKRYDGYLNLCVKNYRKKGSAFSRFVSVSLPLPVNAKMLETFCQSLKWDLKK